MSTQETIALHAKRMLMQLVSQIAEQVPSTICNENDQIVHLVRMVCASFLKSPVADTLDLCVEIQSDTDYVTVSADLVVGGSGRILSEMDAVTIRKDNDIKEAVDVLEEYVRSQANTIVAELKE